VPHLLWHGTSFFFSVSSEGQPHSAASYDSSYDTEGDVENLF
jgi:hypothetical protein